ncbi:MAG: hypothetical protein ACRDPE_01990 [Solirubrobacterales bacterium]
MRNFGLQTRSSIGAVTGPVGLLLGLIAVVISLSSTADATGHRDGGKITARQLAPGAVTAKAIAPGAVGKKALAKAAVTSKALSNDSVNGRVLRDGAVTGGSIAEGAVTASALATGSVTSKALAQGAVGAPSIANDAVTKAAIAPGSVYGAALGAESIHMTPIIDRDQVASNPEWTASNTEVALCAPGEALLGTGFIFTEPGTREVSFLRAAPFLASTGNGVAGEIASNSGGSARAQIMAICLGS